jgi:pyruvate kinase
MGIFVERAVRELKSVGKPWIMATQIVEGLERFVIPTRAEICDITHWVNEGVSAIMLSYETAFGPKPIEAVGCVKQIIDAVKRGRD